MIVAFVPVAFGYGTTVRSLAVADQLRQRGHACVFLASESIRSMIDRYGFPIHPIPDVVIHAHESERPSHQLFRQWSAPGFLARQLTATVQALQATGAEVVVFSNSMTGALAAATLGLRSVSLFQPSILGIPSLALAPRVIETWLRFVLLRARSDLARPVPSAFLGDRSFIPSIPPLIHWPWPLPPGLALHRDEVEPVGGLLTQRPEDLPPRGVLLQELGIQGAPFVYGTVGGAIFSLDLVRAVADAIRRAGCSGLVSGGSIVTSDVSRQLSDDRVRVVHFVPDDFRAIKAADLLIWHGGHETMMEAVACGTPAIGLPYQLDQFANVDGIVHAGAGRKLSPEGLEPGPLAGAIHQVIQNRRYAERMETLRRVNDGYGGAPAVADAVEALGSVFTSAPGARPSPPRSR